MSTLTADGRRRLRDHQRDAMIYRLGKDPKLAGLPVHQRVTLGEFKLIGRQRQLYWDIRRRGVMLPDGTVNPNGSCNMRFTIGPAGAGTASCWRGSSISQKSDESAIPPLSQLQKTRKKSNSFRKPAHHDE